jgi:hypothetical protein
MFLMALTGKRCLVRQVILTKNLSFFAGKSYLELVDRLNHSNREEGGNPPQHMTCQKQIPSYTS